MSKYDHHNNPQRIYNVDETGLQPEHRPPNVIAAKRSKSPAITSPRSTTVTVIGCASASGHSIPLFFIFKGKSQNNNLIKGATPGAKYTMSGSGWLNTAVFQEYIQEQFLPNVCGRPTSKHPVLLLLDGHSSHTLRSIIELARSHHIILHHLARTHISRTSTAWRFRVGPVSRILVQIIVWYAHWFTILFVFVTQFPYPSTAHAQK